jgi:Tol biopolymer transport system component
VSGGAALTLGDAADTYGASWGSQGMIAFAPTFSGALQQVSDAGGISQPLSRLEKGEAIQRWPEFLPSGKAMLFTTGSLGFVPSIVVQSVVTGERRNLIQGGNYPHYAPSGQGPYLPTSATIQNYDVSLDGQRFLMLKPTEQSQAAPTQINVVQNWFEELKRRVPGK